MIQFQKGKKMFGRFDEIYTNRHEYAGEGKKRTGGKIINPEKRKEF
jgi:hypothetical protein